MHKHVSTLSHSILKFIFHILIFSQLILISCAQDKDISRPLKAPRGYLNETLLKAFYATGLLDLVDVEPSIPVILKEHKGVVYKKLNSGDLKLDIYRRKDLTKSVPVLVFIHGGAWIKGKRSDYLRYLVDYAEKGYVTVSISYRLTDVARFPAQVYDVKKAIEWIRLHANEYRANPGKIAVIGGSAGGHLAMMLGYSNENEFTIECDTTFIPKVQAIVNLYGPTDLTTNYAINRGEVKGLIGKTYQEAPQEYQNASPSNYITVDDPPTLIFHGTIDSLVPVSQSDSLHNWLNTAGVFNDYHRLKGWPHTMDVSKKINEYCQFYMDAFFEKYLLFDDPKISCHPIGQ